jgi:hypothetical protein
LLREKARGKEAGRKKNAGQKSRPERAEGNHMDLDEVGWAGFQLASMASLLTEGRRIYGRTMRLWDFYLNLTSAGNRNFCCGFGVDECMLAAR